MQEESGGKSEPHAWRTSPRQWSWLESVSVCQSMDAVVLCQPLIGFHCSTAAWKYPSLLLSCRDMIILAEGSGPAQSLSSHQTVQITMSAHPMNKMGHLIESECFLAPLPPQHYLAFSSRLLSALRQLRLPFLLGIEIIPASPQQTWKPVHRAPALNESDCVVLKAATGTKAHAMVKAGQRGWDCMVSRGWQVAVLQDPSSSYCFSSPPTGNVWFAVKKGCRGKKTHCGIWHFGSTHCLSLLQNVLHGQRVQLCWFKNCLSVLFPVSQWHFSAQRTEQAGSGGVVAKREQWLQESSCVLALPGGSALVESGSELEAMALAAFSDVPAHIVVPSGSLRPLAEVPSSTRWLKNWLVFLPSFASSSSAVFHDFPSPILCSWEMSNLWPHD